MAGIRTCKGGCHLLESILRLLVIVAVGGSWGAQAGAIGAGSAGDIADSFQLPEGYVAEKLFVPPLAGILYVARSQSGVVYLSHFTHNAGISVLDPVQKTAARIMDLPSEAGKSAIVGGPGDTALIGVDGEIWQVSPDGSHVVWGKRGGRPLYFTSDDRLLGSTHDGSTVVELLPDGNVSQIAGGFSLIYDMVVGPDGTIYVSDWVTGNVTRIGPDGRQIILIEQLVVNDPIDLGVDEEGNLYFDSSSSGRLGGFVKMDVSSDAFTRYNLYGQRCTEHLADFVLIAPGKLVFVDPTLSQVAWEDLGAHDGGLLIGSQGANTHAADIGPDDALYIGVSGCGAAQPGQVVRIDHDGTRTVHTDGLEGEIRDIAFDLRGGLYVATSTPLKGGALYYVSSPGSHPMAIPDAVSYNISSIAFDKASGHILLTQHGSDTISEFSLSGLAAEHPISLPKKAANFIIDTSTDGLLYAYVSEWERRDTGPVIDQWFLSVDLTKGTSAIILPLRNEGCCAMGNLSVDQQGNLWWIGSPGFEMYKVESNGNATRFARNLPIDPASINVDSQGGVYFTSSAGIYHVHKQS